MNMPRAQYVVSAVCYFHCVFDTILILGDVTQNMPGDLVLALHLLSPEGGFIGILSP